MRSWLPRVLKEPLFHFAVLGFLLFLAGRDYETRTDVYRIEVTPAHAAQLARGYALQFGTPPDPATLEQLIQSDIHDEILFRQGKALKLDQNDEIVRRRIVQKEQFLMQNLHGPAEPTDTQLSAYYAAHADRYAAASRVAFSHIFFAVGADGDAFPDLYDFSAFEPEQVERLFGRTELASAVFTAPVGRWSGPFRSAYGWHLIYVANRAAPTRPPLADVRERVRSDYLQDAQDRANTAAFDKLARRFTIVRADRKAAP